MALSMYTLSSPLKELSSPLKEFSIERICDFVQPTVWLFNMIV